MPGMPFPGPRGGFSCRSYSVPGSSSELSSRSVRRTVRDRLACVGRTRSLDFFLSPRRAGKEAGLAASGIAGIASDVPEGALAGGSPPLLDGVRRLGVKLFRFLGARCSMSSSSSARFSADSSWSTRGSRETCETRLRCDPVRTGSSNSSMKLDLVVLEEIIWTDSA